MTLAAVKVLPEPVTPSKVWRSKPLVRPSDNAEIAFGWSPAGVSVVASLNGELFDIPTTIAHRIVSATKNRTTTC